MSTTATLADDAPLDPDDELLVAYLDGELDARTESELMNRLLDDEQLNLRLQNLQAGWEWLDKLPDAAPSEKLVESTLALVVADIVKAAPSKKSRWAKYRWQIGIAMACVMGVVIALAAVAMIQHNRYQQQLSDLTLAENLDALNFGSDMALMRNLAADHAWTQMIAASREVGELQSTTSTNLASTPLEEREETLANLPLVDRASLASRWERFSRLPENNLQQIRKTAAAVAQQPDSESLLETMQVYAVWRETLPTELRDQIESQDSKVQREAIDKAIEITQSKIMRLSRDQLDDETVERIYFVLQQILQQRIESGDEATITHVESVRKFAGDRDYEPFAIFGIVNSGQRFGRRPPGGGRPGRPASLRSDELDMIRVMLPENAQDVLSVISESGQMEDTLVLRSITLTNWAEEAARRKMPFRPEDTTALDRYNELSDEERARLDLMPPKEIIKRISQRSRFP